MTPIPEGSDKFDPFPGEKLPFGKSDPTDIFECAKAALLRQGYGWGKREASSFLRAAARVKFALPSKKGSHALARLEQLVLSLRAEGMDLSLENERVRIRGKLP